MTTKTNVTVRVTRRFDVSPERVFDAWLDPKTAGKWLFATPTGKISRVEIDARIGGSFNITRQDKETFEHIGEYLEIDRPSRLAFTFIVPKLSKVVTQVTIDIVPKGKGCELTLTHTNVLPDWESSVQEGWTGILEGLAHNL